MLGLHEERFGSGGLAAGSHQRACCESFHDPILEACSKDQLSIAVLSHSTRNAFGSEQGGRLYQAHSWRAAPPSMNAVPHEGGPLPEFRRPPVVEVAASVQFAQIRSLDAAKLGALWMRFRDRYPRTEQHPPLPSTQETFAPQRIPRFGFSVGPAFPAPRLWFLDESATRLVQVQSNRLIVNWRQLDTDQDYPRYPVLRDSLTEAFSRLTAFVRDEGLGEIVPDQAELTYVNHLRSRDRASGRESLSRLLSFWHEPTSVVLRGTPEEASLRLQYVMKQGTEPIGRFFVEVESAYTPSQSEPLYVMSLVGRGAPFAQNLEGALGFLDEAHVWIVRGFADLTTSEAHDRWERIR